MHDTLPREFPELAVPTPGTELLAVILFQQGEPGFTHPPLVVEIVVNSSVMSLLERIMLLMFDYRPCSVLTTLFTEFTPRVALVTEEYLQVFGVPPIDLHPNMTVIGFLRREMNVFGHQSLHINENQYLTKAVS